MPPDPPSFSMLSHTISHHMHNYGAELVNNCAILVAQIQSFSMNFFQFPGGACPQTPLVLCALHTLSVTLKGPLFLQKNLPT